MVNPNAAFDKFKDKHVNTKGLGQFTGDYKSLFYSFKYLLMVKQR